MNPEYKNGHLVTLEESVRAKIINTFLAILILTYLCITFLTVLIGGADGKPMRKGYYFQNADGGPVDNCNAYKYTRPMHYLLPLGYPSCKIVQWLRTDFKEESQ